MSATAPQIITIPDSTGRLDHAQRFIALLTRAEPQVRRRFLRLVRESRALLDLEELATLIELGRIDEALAVTDEIAPGLVAQLQQVYLASGINSAAVIRSQVPDSQFDFNLANQRALNSLANDRLRLVVGFNQEQRAATQLALTDAFRRGRPPIEAARAFRSSIGLTGNQVQIINNYRADLEGRSSRALTRELRDRRFDPTVRRAIRTGQPLTQAQIDRMVERYSDRWLQFRSRTIARTETLTHASQADEEAYRQAIEEGVFPEEALTNRWRARLRNTRDSHLAPLNGQTQPLGVPFISGAGNRLRYPGDSAAPASEVVNCECVLERVIAQEEITRRRVAAA